ncbi:MAG: hypothetical protein IPK89_13985 [Sphingomonadales bacterium]|nr:hypothetical protein [Sphingomonadales bacterium]
MPLNPPFNRCALGAFGLRSQDDGRGWHQRFDQRQDENGVVAINADGKTGKVSVNLPGFNADLNLPKMMLAIIRISTSMA